MTLLSTSAGAGVHPFMRIRSMVALVATLLATLAILATPTAVSAQNSIVEEYFVPLPENDIFASFDTINSAATTPVNTTIYIAIGGDTVVVYDQWENGYEASLVTPLDLFSSGEDGCPPANPDGTQIWGNSNLCDGVPPDFGSDLLSNGDVIRLVNAVSIPRNPAAIRFDGGDYFGTSYPVAANRTAYPDQPGSVLAGGVEVLRTNQWGTEFRAPIGQNVSGSTNPWQYARFFVMAGSNGTEVFKNGASQGILNRGDNRVIPVNVNDLITANNPIQIDLITGDVNSSYEMRWYSLPPLPSWTDSYYMPVGDPLQNGSSRVAAWVYNPDQSASITVQWQIGSETGSLVVGPRSAAFGPSVGGANGRAGAHFFTANGAPFYALAQIDTTPGYGEIYDWGFPLIPETYLSPQMLVGIGLGCTEPGVTINNDPCLFGNIDNARSFVWVMPISGTDVPIYVAYDSRLPTCPALPGAFDETFNLDALEIRIVQQAGDLDMTGARIWTCTPNVNLVAAWGQDPDHSYSGDDQALDQGVVVVPLLSVQLEKSSAFTEDNDHDGAISPGDTIRYAMTLVNNGAYPATLTLSDNLPPDLQYVPNSTAFRIINDPAAPVPDDVAPSSPFPLDEDGLSTIGGSPIVLQPGEVLELTYVVVIDPDTDCTATLRNRGTVAATFGANGSNLIDGSNEIVVLQCNPGIDVEKSTNTQDADTPTGPYIQTGGQVTWRYTVTNIGDVALNNVQLTDDVLGPITSVCTPAIPSSFAPGASFTCERTGPAEEGQYDNLATARGTSSISATQVVSDTDPSHYFGQSPAIEIGKLTNGSDADFPLGPLVPIPSTVTWTYEITNTGNVPLTNVVVTDDRNVVVSCPQTTLDVEESMECTASGPAAPGPYDNTGTVTAIPPAGSTITDSDPSHYFGLNPSIDIEKYTNGEDADTLPGPSVGAGDFVFWTYIVTNTGNVPLVISVTDDQGATVSCSREVLTPQASTTCSATGIAVLGQYTNTATVIGNPPVGSPVTDSDPSHYNGEPITPSQGTDIRIIKLTNSADADLPPGPEIRSGDPVTWSYLVFNSGSAPLAPVTVTDSHSITVTCPDDALDSLEAMICTGTGVATSGQYTNTGFVSGDPGEGSIVTDSNPSHYFGTSPSIVVEKYTNGVDADERPGPFVPVGDTVLWTYIVTNTGNVPLTNIEVEDDKGVTVNCPSLTLLPAESMTCTGDEGTAVAGQYDNVGTVTALPPDGPPVTDNDPSHYFGEEASIDIEKATNGEDADAEPGPLVPAGSEVTWTYVVTNTGNVTLTNVSVTDDQDETLNCGVDILPPGSSFTCTTSGTAQPDQYANIGTVKGTPPSGTDAEDSDPSHYFGLQPAIEIKKYTEDVDADTPPGPMLLVGSTVRWTYVITNVGNVTLSNFRLTDTDVTGFSCPRLISLNPGQSATCSAEAPATAGQYENVGTITGTPITGGSPVSDTDPSHYYGAITSVVVEKSTNGQDADAAPGPEIIIGEEVVWTYVITNTGNVPLRDLLVTDDQLGIIACPVTNLSPGASTTCSVTGEAVEGQYENTADVIAYPPEGVEVIDDDPSHYTGVEPTALPEEEQPGRARIFLPWLGR